MEELSLREAIEIVIKGKWIIAAVTAICIVISLIISVFVIDPVYEAQTMLMISPIKKSEAQAEDINNFSPLVDAISRYPEMSIDTYREQVKAPAILQYIRDEMNMKDVPLSKIASKISVNAIKNTNLLTISVTDVNPDIAAQIANLVSERFTKFVSETNQKQAVSSAEFIENQMQKEKENMEKLSEEYKNFLSQPRGPEEVKMELDSKLLKITEYKTQLSQIKVDENATRASVNSARSLIGKTPQKLITDSTLLTDELLSGVIKEKTGLTSEDLANIKMSTEQINMIYVELSNMLNQLEVQLSNLEAQRMNIEQVIQECQKEIENLQVEYAEKQQEYDILKLDLDLSKEAYNAYQQKYKESMIMQSAEIGKSSIVIVSEAIPPINPVAPKKVLNVAIAGVLGIGISFAIVFIREYLIRSKK
ncbi:GumC family protein [Acetivibrio mesophilus]|uniref:Lipopolysaccharide biosynthesis protein n=1 Tax=Acetivibrio mesophilus TaxID=2487273 RepID=A0A4Q0I2U6_9FIRM|nr:Wzz/FepE/Etk N-terminal domain-containing protein [Acetivibrio mesophilus]ODM27126.1 lipopolysaccharide biosynthesis protein [Clostridium sp. Bc-iso-3]RXE57995.1 lipopolysaccharide biosynthesis protein [Acetivibrio mesophilus]HHV30634.1 lipopolysaccharide biosynthesis protein [Clostridium sp.]